MIQVLERSRAALRLRNDALLRLDQNTTITFAGPKDQPAASWIDLFRGALHFTSRVPRGVKVLTPFVNGTVEGTEFWIEVAAERTTVTVFEGRLAAENAAGRLLLEAGQSAIARAGQPPVAFTVSGHATPCSEHSTIRLLPIFAPRTFRTSLAKTGRREYADRSPSIGKATCRWPSRA